ncbi:MAG: bacillithiol biosynthesis cysteine-adding enzyme BshC [Chitinophagaceae bacterium]|nr:MAG: bacillithiol biosynthesis cysteine-adding enzyme BshC [Chitinophagaceae bacterium]
MDYTSTRLPYGPSGYFTKIIVDYVEGNDKLSPFYEHKVSVEGLAAAIMAREKFPTDRALLVNELRDQYKGVETSEKVLNNIEALLGDDTFSIVTAHQPVIFTGTLYFIYKILHTVKLAEACRIQFPGRNFVPVFYMGSEDADLEELGKIYMGIEKITWDTRQKGAVGRMNTKGLEKIITRIEGEISGLPHGNELIALFRDCYLNSPDVQTATFKLINTLFQDFGVVVLVPDRAALKQAMHKIFEDDLFNRTPSSVVEKSVEELGAVYKVQANPREINLFYLKDQIRELFIQDGGNYRVKNTELVFTEAGLRAELEDHPERFSPNVILRGLFQETILPDIAFIGGGGETAYWLELKALFNHYNTPFPVLVLRNSFLLITQKWVEKLNSLGISETEIFKEPRILINEIVEKRSGKQLTLEHEIEELKSFYAHISVVSSDVDVSLLRHVDALKSRALKNIEELEKKILKAEKRKFEDQNRQVSQVKEALFPKNGLQERVDNFITWYAKYGKSFFDLLYENSLTTEQEFVVLTEKAPTDA